MDCHRCIHVRYDGCHYGRCSHAGHSDVILVRGGDKRPYNRQVCSDFVLRKRCSNCKYWVRGIYFADGKTPSEKGRCSLRCRDDGKTCKLWKQGNTSWKKSMHA